LTVYIARGIVVQRPSPARPDPARARSGPTRLARITNRAGSGRPGTRHCARARPEANLACRAGPIGPLSAPRPERPARSRRHAEERPAQSRCHAEELPAATPRGGAVSVEERRWPAGGGAGEEVARPGGGGGGGRGLDLLHRRPEEEGRRRHRPTEGERGGGAREDRGGGRAA